MNENVRLKIIQSCKYVDYAFLIDEGKLYLDEDIINKYNIDLVIHAHDKKDHEQHIKIADKHTNNFYSSLINQNKYLRIDYGNGLSTTNIINNIKGNIIDKNILILGLGNISGHILEFLSRENFCGKIYVGSRNLDWLERKCNNVIFGNMLQNLSAKNIEYVKVDIGNKTELKSLLENIEVDIIINSVTREAGQTANYEITYLYGANGWIPWGINYLNNIFETLKELKKNPYILNLPNTDMIGCIFKNLGYDMSKFIGMGNINHNIPKIKNSLYKLYGYDYKRVQVKIICSHWFGNSLSKKNGVYVLLN